MGDNKDKLLKLLPLGFRAKIGKNVKIKNVTVACILHPDIRTVWNFFQY